MNEDDLPSRQLHRSIQRQRRAPFYGMVLLPLLPVFLVIKGIIWIVKNS